MSNEELDAINHREIIELANIIAERSCDSKDCAPCIRMGRRCNDYLKAERAIKAGYHKQNNWISVEERLPDETKDYLVVLNGEDIDIRLFNSKNEPYQTYSSMMNKFLFLDERRDWHVTDKVTHWMPLPEPPKGD